MKLQAYHPFFIDKGLIDTGCAGIKPYCLFRQGKGIAVPVKHGRTRRQHILQALRNIADSFNRKPADLFFLIGRHTYFRPKTVELYKLLTENEIFVKRTRGIGIMPADVAINYGWSGPCFAVPVSNGI